jgi:hypothetical protein
MVSLVRIGLFLSLAAGLQAQSSADDARQEQEKKKPKPSSPAPSYTDEDLKAPREKGKGSFNQLEGPSPGASPSPSPGASPSAEPDRVLQEKLWRARFAEARARVAEADARAYEERIEVVYVSPGIPVQQKVLVKVETEELRQARKALDDLQDELRRSGGLPGWGR